MMSMKYQGGAILFTAVAAVVCSSPTLHFPISTNAFQPSSRSYRNSVSLTPPSFITSRNDSLFDSNKCSSLSSSSTDDISDEIGNSNGSSSLSKSTFTSTPIIESTQGKETSIFYQITTFIGKTASSFVSISFFILLAYHRDALLLSLFLGSILNSIISKILKKVINHERPDALQANNDINLKPSDGGMPSSHAMSLGFIGTVILRGLVPGDYRLFVGLTMVLYSAVALRYRVRDNLHTVEQIGVGLLLGLGNGFAWLSFALGLAVSNNLSAKEATGPVLSWIRENWVSSETGLFPYPALAIPIIVGLLVVGSFERRIEQWLKNRKDKNIEK